MSVFAAHLKLSCGQKEAKTADVRAMSNTPILQLKLPRRTAGLRFVSRALAEKLVSMKSSMTKPPII